MDSTNEEAKRGGEAGAEHGTVYCAKSQTAGKGRRGRSWLSASENNLYFTLLLRPQLKPESVSMLTLVMAQAVAEAIKEKAGLPVGIKWPNDIVVSKKKVCGILSEMKLEQQECAYCVIGVGINVEQASFPEELKDKATSLYEEMNTSKGEISHRKPKTEDLLISILSHFEELYESVSEAKSLLPMQERYNALLVNKDNEVRVLEPGNAYNGVARGITPFGELLVERTDHSLEKVYAGEVSVRGLYGYV